MKQRKLWVPWLIALAVISACGSEDKKNETGEGAMIASVSELTSAADRRTLVGRKVELADAIASDVSGNYVFWIGERHAGVPVARLDKMNNPNQPLEHVTRGARVRLSGTVRLLETVSATDKIWDRINERERADMMAARVYVAADSVMIVH